MELPKAPDTVTRYRVKDLYENAPHYTANAGTAAPEQYKASEATYKLQGPLVIKTPHEGLKGKRIHVIGGSVWINGNVENCTITVERDNAASSKEPIGLYINGSVAGTSTIKAPNTMISGAVNLSSPSPDAFIANRIEATEGNIEIGGNVVGQDSSRNARIHAGNNQQLFNLLDTLTAAGNLNIEGTVCNIGLSTTNELAHQGAEGDNVIRKNGDNFTREFITPKMVNPKQSHSRIPLAATTSGLPAF